MNRNDKFVQEDGKEEANSTIYRSVVRGFIYLTHTGPNLAFSVGMVSRFMQNPSKVHFGAAKRIFKISIWNCILWNSIFR